MGVEAWSVEASGAPPSPSHDPRALAHRLAVDAQDVAVEIEVRGGEERSRGVEVPTLRSSQVVQGELQYRCAEVALTELGQAVNGGSQESPRLARHAIATGAGPQEPTELRFRRDASRPRSSTHATRCDKPAGRRTARKPPMAYALPAPNHRIGSWRRRDGGPVLHRLQHGAGERVARLLTACGSTRQ